MNSPVVVDDVTFYCPLLRKNIVDSLCYEINSVAFGLCKPSLIGLTADRASAEPVCEKCKNKQI